MIELFTWVITLAFCAFAIGVGLHARGKASRSFGDYAIAGASLPLLLVACTDLSTIMGAGNFMGEAEKGFNVGYSQLAFVVGEQGSKIVFALLFAGFAGRFAYRTLAEMMDDLLLRDRVSRGLIGLLTLALMLAWIGGQGLGLGLLFHAFTGSDPTLIIFMSTAIFIAYATLGGMHAVARVEFVIGIMIAVFGVVYYCSVYSLVDFSPVQLNHKLSAANLSGLTHFRWSIDTVTLFLTGLLGVLGAQAYWQRCYAAKSGATARRGMLIAGVIAVIFVCCTVFVGMIARALNPDLNAADAMPWLMKTQVPIGITLVVFALILIAANSTAASCLNAATVIIVNDLILPARPDASNKTLITTSRLLTVAIGLFGALAAMYASSIIDLFAQAYTLLACSVVPVMLVGLLWRKDLKRRFVTGEHNSRITPWGARTGLVSGALIGHFVGLYTGLAAAVVLTVVVSLATRRLGPADDTRVAAAGQATRNAE